MPRHAILANGRLTGPDLAEQLRGELSSRLGGMIRRLRVVCIGDRCVLYGEATSFYAKQLAQVAAMQSIPSGRLENEIAVKALNL